MIRLAFSLLTLPCVAYSSSTHEFTPAPRPHKIREMPSRRDVLISGVTRLAAVPALRWVGAVSAQRRRRSLVLVYHRVTPRPRSVLDVVPSVSPSTLRAHLDALQEFAAIVPISTLLSSPDHDRLRIAITFDDDDVAHVEHALPVLRAAGVPATFFLSGRALNHLPDYWWSHLERALAAHGVDAVATALGVSGGVSEMAAACEDPRVAQRLSAMDAGPPSRQLGAADIADLVSGGMTIGFHTLHHHVLPTLPDEVLKTALTSGRDVLEAVAGRPVDAIAYPYGRASVRVARAAADSGYRAGFVTSGRAMSRTVDPFRIPRWEPGPVAPAQLRAEALLRLHAPVRSHTTETEPR
jgi:peptidoglycan/xylan/chitin deacetylase (PgdA/CDA1 family)